MPANWISTACALPSEGEQVEFMLDERECPLRGVFILGRFESRWTYYAPANVRLWRSSARSTECLRHSTGSVRFVGLRA